MFVIVVIWILMKGIVGVEFYGGTIDLNEEAYKCEESEYVSVDKMISVETEFGHSDAYGAFQNRLGIKNCFKLESYYIRILKPRYYMKVYGGDGNGGFTNMKCGTASKKKYTVCESRCSSVYNILKNGINQDDVVFGSVPVITDTSGINCIGRGYDVEVIDEETMRVFEEVGAFNRRALREKYVEILDKGKNSVVYKGVISDDEYLDVGVLKLYSSELDERVLDIENEHLFYTVYREGGSWKARAGKGVYDKCCKNVCPFSKFNDAISRHGNIFFDCNQNEGNAFYFSTGRYVYDNCKDGTFVFSAKNTLMVNVTVGMSKKDYKGCGMCEGGQQEWILWRNVLSEGTYEVDEESMNMIHADSITLVKGDFKDKRGCVFVEYCEVLYEEFKRDWGLVGGTGSVKIYLNIRCEVSILIRDQGGCMESSLFKLNKPEVLKISVGESCSTVNLTVEQEEKVVGSCYAKVLLKDVGAVSKGFYAVRDKGNFTNGVGVGEPSDILMSGDAVKYGIVVVGIIEIGLKFTSFMYV